MSILQTLKARGSLLVFASMGLGVLAYEWRQAKEDKLIATALAKPKPAGSSNVLAEGRLVAYPDAAVTVAAERSGKLLRVLVHERDQVKAGDVIAELDVSEQRAALREAWARVKEAESDVAYSKKEHQRSEQLLAQNVVARAAFDRSEHDAEGAARRRSSLLATAARLETELAKATITAPLSGTVTGRFADTGSYLAAGAPLVTIADLGRLRVQAEIGEFDAARVALGASVSIRAEGYAESWRGSVEEIPEEVVARQARPLDPSRPVDTRVLLVKVKLSERLPLRLGQRVEVEIVPANQI